MDNRQREIIHILMNQHSKPMVQAAYRRIGDWHLARDLFDCLLESKSNMLSLKSNCMAIQDIEQFDNERTAPQLSQRGCVG